MTAPVPAAFGAALYRHRTTRRWSLQRAAQEAGMSVMTVTRAEDGHNIGLAPALALAAAYETTIDTLLAGPEAVTAAELPPRTSRKPGSGRKPLLDDRQAATIRRMHAATGPDGKRRHTVLEIAETVGVPRSTVYGYLKKPEPTP